MSEYFACIHVRVSRACLLPWSAEDVVGTPGTELGMGVNFNERTRDQSRS